MLYQMLMFVPLQRGMLSYQAPKQMINEFDARFSSIVNSLPQHVIMISQIIPALAVSRSLSQPASMKEYEI